MKMYFMTNMDKIRLRNPKTKNIRASGALRILQPAVPQTRDQILRGCRRGGFCLDHQDNLKLLKENFT